MKVLIIGGTRFLGLAIARALRREGHQVSVFHRGHTRAALPEGVREILGDKSDEAAVKQALGGHDALVDTVCSAQDVLKIARIAPAGLKRWVHCGSVGVYAPAVGIPSLEDDPCDPPDPLGGFRSKLEQDQALMATGLPVVSLRACNIYGPGDVPLETLGGRNPQWFRDTAAGKEIVIPNDGRGLLQPGHVADLAEAFVLALVEKAAVGRIYNMAPPQAVTLNQYADLLKEALGSKSPVRHVPMEEIVASGSTGFEAGLRFVCEHMCVGVGRIERELGWRAETPLDRGLAENIAAMRRAGIL